MAKQKRKLFIGTSGWVYPHWEGIFYSEDLPKKDKLKYFSKHFKTVEVNHSFYRLPSRATYQNWEQQTPNDFVFAVKVSRFITHIKRLKEVGDSWKIFLENALELKDKLGPILFQFPLNFSATDENIKRLEKFLDLLRGQTSTAGGGLTSTSLNLRFAFEFRHKSWYSEERYKLLRKYGVAWVIADSPNYPKAEEITADFVYIRMHGARVLFSSKYTDKELKNLTQKIKKWLRNYDVYVYFNNDAEGYAVENAKQLLKCVYDEIHR